MNRIKVVITSGYRWPYFEWFLLGLYELSREGKIKLEFKIPMFSKLLTIVDNKYKNTIRLIDKLHRTFEKETYNLTGYVDAGGVRKSFAIDSADSPFLYNAKDLADKDVYFKEQCPIDLADEGFSLTPQIVIPWLDHEHCDKNKKKLTAVGKRKRLHSFSAYKSKIKPLMVGPRSISGKSISFNSLREGYDRYISDRNEKRRKKIMCYFGNALGPKVNGTVIEPDYDWEADIMSYYADKVSHPNVKRARLAEIIKRIPESDVRIISNTNSDGGIIENAELVIPLKEFCAHIARFQYNANVSGYRLSIPTRFIESFIVGTAIITDKLHVKWYLPFTDEVKETSDMGYLPEDEVDWKQITVDVNNLPDVDPKIIIDEYEKKWAPKVVAKYIVESVIQA